MADFEQILQNAVFANKGEKTFIDKLLAKEEAGRVKDLISKNNLTRQDLLELLYLLSGTESKLLNYGAWDRYIILKYFVWIRQFIKIAENLFDYQDDILRKTSTCLTCKKLLMNFEKEKKECTCKKPNPMTVLTPRTKKLLFNTQRNLEHAAKFNIDLYFNIARTTLSLGATAFMEMLKNKFELSYPQGQPVNTPIQQQAGVPRKWLNARTLKEVWY